MRARSASGFGDPVAVTRSPLLRPNRIASRAVNKCRARVGPAKNRLMRVYAVRAS